MKKNWRLFLKVVRSYSLEEKVASVFLAGIILLFSVQGMVEMFSRPVFAKDVYSEGLISDRPTLLNPLFIDISETNRDLSALVFSGLTKYDPATKTFVNDLAELTLSPDHKNYHFTLKPNAEWHDGQPVTSDDVYFTFHDLIQNPDFPNIPIKLNFDGIEIKKIDDKNIEFHLKAPNSFFITNLNVGIVPRHILGQTAVKDLRTSGFNLKPVGTGPYKVDQAMEVYGDGRQKVTLRAFEKYYGGAPKIREIHFNIYTDEKSLLQEKNALDIIAKTPALLKSDAGKTLNQVQFINYELPQYTGVFFNMEKPLFKKDKVRLALIKSIDKSELLKKLKDKIAIDTPLLELNQSDWIYKPNLDEARGALFDSGFKKYPDTSFRKDSTGNILKLNLLVRAVDQNAPQWQETNDVTGYLKKSWANAGIEVDIQLVDAATYADRLQKRDYDMVLAGQSLGYNLDTYSYWHSSQADSRGLNLSNYKRFAADHLIQQIRESFESGQKDQKLKELAATIAKDIPGIFLYRPQYIFMTDGKVKNIQLKNLAHASDRFANVVQWCIQCEQIQASGNSEQSAGKK